MEEAVKLEHILVTQVTLNLYLSPQLMRDLGLLQLPLVHHFDRNNEFTLLLSSEVDVAELSAAKRLLDIKVFDVPLSLPWLLLKL